MSFSSEKKRLDYFVVWGHGIGYLHEMVDLIDQQDYVDVLYVKKRNISNLKKFIWDIYAEEWPHVPKHHTLSKTEFLYHVPKQAALILVMNRNPKVRIQDNKNPLFRMPESETIKNIKNLIRKKYDPNKGGRGVVQLVPGFNPDQHVVHASDFPEQIQNALNIFDMRDVTYWIKYWNKKYNPKSLTDPQNVTIKEVSIDNIQMKILNGQGNIYASKIQDSPHYDFVLGNTKRYEDYWATFCGKTLKENHCPSYFKRLCKNLKYLAPPYQNNLIKVEKQGSLYYTVDGDHRLAILKARGINNIKVEIVNV
tara:strand:- start:70 stop:996 length:927 start_codon:yes stop_codon:yes gene_type:complete